MIIFVSNLKNISFCGCHCVCFCCDSVVVVFCFCDWFLRICFVNFFEFVLFFSLPRSSSSSCFIRGKTERKGVTSEILFPDKKQREKKTRTKQNCESEKVSKEKCVCLEQWLSNHMVEIQWHIVLIFIAVFSWFFVSFCFCCFVCCCAIFKSLFLLVIVVVVAFWVLWKSFLFCFVLFVCDCANCCWLLLVVVLCCLLCNFQISFLVCFENPVALFCAVVLLFFVGLSFCWQEKKENYRKTTMFSILDSLSAGTQSKCSVVHHPCLHLTITKRFVVCMKLLQKNLLFFAYLPVETLPKHHHSRWLQRQLVRLCCCCQSCTLQRNKKTKEIVLLCRFVVFCFEGLFFCFSQRGVFTTLFFLRRVSMRASKVCRHFEGFVFFAFFVFVFFFLPQI